MNISSKHSMDDINYRNDIVSVCVDTCEVIDSKYTRRMRFIHDTPINHTEINEPIDLDKSTLSCCPSKVVFNNPFVPRRIYIDIFVDGVPVRALADTGAERICIGGDVLEKVNDFRRRKVLVHTCMNCNF